MGLSDEIILIQKKKMAFFRNSPIGKKKKK